MSCFKSSNNKFYNATARMSDGRSFTDYRPNHEINTHIINNNDIKNIHEYRRFLSRNTEEIIKRNQNYIFLKNGNFDCKGPYEIGTMLPEKTKVVCNQHTCNRLIKNENGFGEGREYSQSKNNLLEPLPEPKLKEDNICLNAHNNFKYYPYDINLNKDVRNAIPSGAKILSGGDPNKFIN